MPTPRENESRDEFVSRCVPIVIDDGAAENPDQAVAICNSMWDDARTGDHMGDRQVHESFVEKIINRKGGSPFGYGVSTAEPYARQLLAMEDLGYKTGRTTPPDQLIKESKGRLVYADPGMIIEEKFAGDVEQSDDDFQRPPNTLMVIRHVLTSSREDRDGDILRSAGARLDPKAPTLWQHQHFLPVGKIVKTVEQNADVLRVVSVLLDINELTSDIAKLIEADVLRFSHGFRVLDYEVRTDKDGNELDGYDVKEFEILEDSFVSVPSNIDAEIELFSRGKLESDMVKAHAKQQLDARPAQVPGASVSLPHSRKSVGTFNIKGVSSDFHPEHQRNHAAYPTHEWASMWLDTEVKNLRIVDTFVPEYAMGNFLSAVKVLTADWKMRDIRKLDEYGADLPVRRETVQLNSKKSDTFVIDGMQFLETPEGKTVLEFSRSYGGMSVSRYDIGERGPAFFEKCWDWVRENNYLRGEAFRLGGTFIDRKGQSLDDIYLTADNTQALRRAVTLVNSGASFISRGMIMMGPPGTGKTLSARAILNNTKATYIWASAKDMRGSGDIKTAYHLARELTPAVVCFEDIDSFYSDYAFDLLKAELDGLDQHNDILTLLTTNHPETLPAALIDRPGRFHDVLEFNLPNAQIRRDMIAAWSPGVTSIELSDPIVKSTDGFSGAHIKDLCDFAKVLMREDSIDSDTALEKACQRILEQRRIIQQLNQNDRQRRRRSVKSVGTEEKTGRVLSQRNHDMLKEVVADMTELAGMELSRSAKALCERCLSKLGSILDSAATDSGEEEDGKTAAQTVLADVVNYVLRADQSDLAQIRKYADMVFNLGAYHAAGEDYRRFTKSM